MNSTVMDVKEMAKEVGDKYIIVLVECDIVMGFRIKER